MFNLLIPMSSIFVQDHMRRAGDVCFSQVFRDGRGMMTCKSVGSYFFLKGEEYLHMLCLSNERYQMELLLTGVSCVERKFETARTMNPWKLQVILPYIALHFQLHVKSNVPLIR